MNRVSQLLKQGRATDAVTSAKEGVSSAPENTKAYSTLVHALMGARDYDTAEQVVSKAIVLAPHEPALRFLRTRVNFARGQFEAALSDAALAINQSERLGYHFYTKSCLLLEAACLGKLGEPQRAIELLQRVGDDVKVSAGQLLTRGSVLKQLGIPLGQGNRGEPMEM